jgi:hypothetical protein
MPYRTLGIRQGGLLDRRVAHAPVDRLAQRGNRSHGDRLPARALLWFGLTRLGASCQGKAEQSYPDSSFHDWNHLHPWRAHGARVSRSRDAKAVRPAIPTDPEVSDPQAAIFDLTPSRHAGQGGRSDPTGLTRSCANDRRAVSRDQSIPQVASAARPVPEQEHRGTCSPGEAC